MSRYYFSSLFLLFSFSIALSSCGKYEPEVDKSYVFYIDESDESLKSSILWLADDLNREMGRKIFVFTHDEKEANSQISFVHAGSEFGEYNEVGWGEWRKETEYENELVRFSGRNPKARSSYSMVLKFDRKYFLHRVENLSDTDRYDLKKLFAHEVCHGLGCVHDDSNPKSIMYKDVAAGFSNEAEFKLHYKKMEDYFDNF